MPTYQVEAISISNFSCLHIFISPTNLHITNKKTFKIDRRKGFPNEIDSTLHNHKNMHIMKKIPESIL